MNPDLLRKIYRKIKKDPAAQEVFRSATGGDPSRRHICPNDWRNAAGNHVFDDHPEAFDITEREGSDVRGWFQSGVTDEELREAQVVDLHVYSMFEALEFCNGNRDILQCACGHQKKHMEDVLDIDETEQLQGTLNNELL